jgi:signal transduction histidine kinase/ActR/RegA family two-component response regulator
MLASIRRSIPRKLTTVILGTALIALLVTALAMVLYEARQYHHAWVSDLTTQADILGKTSEAALMFDDPAAAAENLGALRQRPQILAGAIYRADGALFASFATTDELRASLPARAEAAGHRIESNQLVVVQPIRQSGQTIGTVYLRARYALLDRLRDYLLLTLLAIVASLLVAMAVATRLQATITGPILSLTRAARQVMDRPDYSLRVQKTSDDEVGVLVDAFNAMLAESGRRASELELAYSNLQQEMMERRAAEDALKAADRRKDEFLATLAHELRNPLAPIRNGLHILQLTNDPSAAAAARTMMDRQLKHMVRLVDDLLDVSRITSGKLVLRREPCRLVDVLETAIEAVRPLIDAKQHRLATRFVDAQLNADPARLSQVFANILNNAAKYTDPGGAIELVCRRLGDLVEVSVTDSGIGMEADKLPLVFDMFMQFDLSLERTYGGLGVGMALAQRLVEMHGGTIVAASDGPGRGSRFTVRLPLGFTAIDSVAPPRSAIDHAVSVPHRVLLVDDNRDFAESLATVLRFNGHTVQIAYDGESALAIAREFRPEVAFLDIGLPGLDGYALAQALRSEPVTSSALLVALTGWGQEKDRERTKAAGFDLHFVKPVDPASVAQVVETLRAGRAAGSVGAAAPARQAR